MHIEQNPPRKTWRRDEFEITRRANREPFGLKRERVLEK
jgi:hypothetical protein